MPGRCVVWGCSNNPKPGISVHQFPKDPNLFKKWQKFVQQNRKYWKAKASSQICSVHFDSNQFEESSLQVQLGFSGSKRILKKRAVPSILSLRQNVACTSTAEPHAKTERSAVRKRRVQQLLQHEVTTVHSKETQNIGSSLVDQQVVSVETELIAGQNSTSITKEAIDEQEQPLMIYEAMFINPQCKVAMTQTVNVSNTRSIGIQCNVPIRCSDAATQCVIPVMDFIQSSTPIHSENEEDMHECLDEDYNESYDSISFECNESEANQKSIPENKYVIFHSMLMSLFLICQLCGKAGATTSSTCKGTLLAVKQICHHCRQSYKWFSQPFVGGIPEGNISLSSSILFSGALPTKTLRFLRFWGVQCYEKRTFFRHQKKFLIPAVNHVWSMKQQNVLQEAKKDVNLICGGDARCDSMGHSAKYGSYTLMDVKQNRILSMEIVQSNEVKGSYHMELEGLKRCLHTLSSAGVNICTLITDRHLQIQKWIREDHEEMTHYFDIWHVAKGLSKKLVAVEKKKGFELVSKWRQSIINHLYWCGLTSDGNGDLALAKWDSLPNHICDIHTGHSELFPSCLHLPLAKRKYFTAGSECYEALTGLLGSKNLRKDVTKLSPEGQTFSIEAYHSLVNQFAPKMFHFGYAAMKCRLLLAALHYNENSRKEQAKTKDGNLQFSLSFPKGKGGSHTLKKIMQECTFSYVAELIAEVTSRVEDASNDIPEELSWETPPPLCHNLKRPDKQSVVNNHISRFLTSAPVNNSESS